MITPVDYTYGFKLIPDLNIAEFNPKQQLHNP